MDTTFWVTLAITAVLSLVMSVVANLYNDRIKEVIEHTKKLRLNKKRETELRTYRFLNGLKGGAPLAYLRVSVDQAGIVSGLLLGLIMMVVGLLISLLLGFFEKIYDFTQLERIGFGAASLLPFAVGNFVFVSALWQRIYYRNLIKKLAHFEEYKKELTAKWGDTAIEP